jgi:Transcription factor S-II (TFIIS), central domain
MLDFNLKKPDRVVLHKRIISFSIPPEALSLMSSTDLASEQEKQSIKLAEEESLAHSILQKTAVPRAKITHKGLQDIEDIDGTLSSQRDTELDREREEEERRDRERMERSRAAQRQQAGSGSVPPESPVVSEHPTWGAPPPLPPHALQPQDPSLSPVERSILNPLFAQSAHTAMNHPVENELNLADLINIDDETSQDGTSAAESAPVVDHPSAESPSEKEHEIQAEQVSPVSAFSPLSPRPTGISPFAVNTSKPDLTTRPSFDLSSVWSAPPKHMESPQNQEPLTAPASAEPKESLMDTSFFGEDTDDNDFDMFLGQDNEAGPSSESVRKEPAFHEYPQVWNGTVGKLWSLLFTLLISMSAPYAPRLYYSSRCSCCRSTSRRSSP